MKYRRLINHKIHVWPSVEEERDYWKDLAEELRAKMAAVEIALNGDWTEVRLSDGTVKKRVESLDV